MSTHVFMMEHRMWEKVELGVKTVECRIGDKAQRVRPGDFLKLVDTSDGKAILARVKLMMMWPTLMDARDWYPGQTGFETWEEFEAAMRSFYQHRVNTEPFTAMYLELPA